MTGLKVTFFKHSIELGVVYHHFKVESRDAQIQLEIKDRFSNMKALRDLLKRRFPATKFPNFPPRAILNSLTTSNIKKRQEKLQKFFDELLLIKSEEVSQEVTRYILDLIDGLQSRRERTELTQQQLQELEKSFIVIDDYESNCHKDSDTNLLKIYQSNKSFIMSEQELKQDLTNQTELDLIDMSTKDSEYELRSTFKKSKYSIEEPNINQAETFDQQTFNQEAQRIMKETQLSMMDLNFNMESYTMYMKKQNEGEKLKSQLRTLQIDFKTAFFDIPKGNDNNFESLKQAEYNLQKQIKQLCKHIQQCKDIMNGEFMRELISEDMMAKF
ncbi:domain containing protein [Stylonychia lemnae]|uniref:Domain containing protein n=1 Tax=Stylonychia lemnae TaxID=5949 RepID=A0A078A103_STYLE|nr:domain containing protein [Stylonychia lemnae]|eukprot:CDW75537.1 domain containing protein [Stylonychia lemnae]